MIRCVRTAVLGALLTLAGVLATADRADAQGYYSYPPETAYSSSPAQAGSYLTYYVPPSNYYAPQAGYSSYYTPAADPGASAASAPVRAWDGGWTLGGYTSPALPYYNSYRASTGIRR